MLKIASVLALAAVASAAPAPQYKAQAEAIFPLSRSGLSAQQPSQEAIVQMLARLKTWATNQKPAFQPVSTEGRRLATAASAGCQTKLDALNFAALGSACNTKATAVTSAFGSGSTTPTSLLAAVTDYCEYSSGTCVSTLKTLFDAATAACSSTSDGAALKAHASFADLRNMNALVCSKDGSTYCAVGMWEALSAMTTATTNPTTATLDKLCSPCAKKLFGELAALGDSDMAAGMEVMCVKSNNEYCFAKLTALSSGIMAQDGSVDFTKLCDPCMIAFYNAFEAQITRKKALGQPASSTCTSSSSNYCAGSTSGTHTCCGDWQTCNAGKKTCEDDGSAQMGSMMAFMCTKAPSGKTCGETVMTALATVKLPTCSEDANGVSTAVSCGKSFEANSACTSCCKDEINVMVGALGCCTGALLRMMGSEGAGMAAYFESKCGKNVLTSCTGSTVDGCVSVDNINSSYSLSKLEALAAADIATKASIAPTAVKITGTTFTGTTAKFCYTINPTTATVTAISTALQTNANTPMVQLNTATDAKANPNKASAVQAGSMTASVKTPTAFSAASSLASSVSLVVGGIAFLYLLH